MEIADNVVLFKAKKVTGIEIVYIFHWRKNLIFQNQKEDFDDSDQII